MTGGNVSRFSWVPSHTGPIGIDFGTRFVRMLQLARHRGQLTITAYAQREMPPAIASSGEGERLRVQAVKTMLAEGHFTGRDVVTALGWDDVQIRNLRVPCMPENEVAEALRFEAADRFGLDPADAEIRFIVAGDVRQGTETKQEAIVLGAPRATVQAQISMLTRMGLNPVAIDVGPGAIFRSFERFLRRDEDHQQVNAFVDLGYSASRVIMSRGPELTFVKSVPIGGRRFDELVSEHLDLSLEEAAQIRIRLYRQHVAAMAGHQGAIDEEDKPVGETSARAVIDALRPALDQLSKEIGLCLRYCSVTFRGPRADAITVVGGEACNADILQVLSDQVNLPFHPGRVTRNIAFEERLDGNERRAGQPEWATVLGLALKPVNEEAVVGS